MKMQVLRNRMSAILTCLCLLSLAILIFPKIGKTNAASASANAYAYKSGQNFVYSTFKAEAYAGAYAPDNSVGVYQLEAEVTGKNPRVTPQVPFFDGTSPSIEKKNTYYAWGDGANMQFSASSGSEITSNVGDDDDDAAAVYP